MRTQHARMIPTSTLKLLVLYVLVKASTVSGFVHVGLGSSSLLNTRSSLLPSPLTMRLFGETSRNHRRGRVAKSPWFPKSVWRGGSSESSTTLALGTSSTYLEYLDSLSGKKFRSYRKKPEDTSANNNNDSNPMEAVVRKADHLLGKIASQGMVQDVRRRRAYYLSDWTDAFKKKRQVIPAIMFLYFACLAPAVSFGTIANEITSGSIGIVEFLLSSGLSGMAYAVMCGQPMAFIAPTGLTLAFISGLFRFCTLQNWPFFPVYAWIGLWTSLYMILLGLAGSSKWIRYCTRFTDEVFNGLLSLNFLYEALVFSQTKLCFG